MYVKKKSPARTHGRTQNCLAHVKPLTSQHFSWKPLPSFSTATFPISLFPHFSRTFRTDLFHIVLRISRQEPLCLGRFTHDQVYVIAILKYGINSFAESKRKSGRHKQSRADTCVCKADKPTVRFNNFWINRSRVGNCEVICSSKLDHCIHVLEKLKDAGRLVNPVHNIHCSVTTRSGLGNMSFLSVDSLDVEKSNVSEISMLYWRIFSRLYEFSNKNK